MCLTVIVVTGMACLVDDLVCHHGSFAAGAVRVRRTDNSNEPHCRKSTSTVNTLDIACSASTVAAWDLVLGTCVCETDLCRQQIGDVIPVIINRSFQSGRIFCDKFAVAA